jgi:lipopolysaccharide biosynthesis regulator YciM
MAQELLFLLLPVAALSGWFIGRRRGQSRCQSSSDCLPLSQDYFRGLNYLINEQSDKALEVFIQMSELNSDTVELHFTLATLFLKRGEVDRAIRIHQNLIARPTLSRDDRNRALYELALDYMRAGLLDRAETLFSELINNAVYGQQSRQQLLDVYQQEKEWEKATLIARRLDGVKGQALAPVLAHFFCEQAEEALARGESSLAMKLIKRALNEESRSVRATLLEAQLHLRSRNPQAAIKSLKRVEQQNGEYLPLILEPLQQAYEKLANVDEFVAYLRQLPEEGSLSPLLKLSEQLQQREGEEATLRFLTQVLRRRPSLRILKRLWEVRANGAADDQALQLALQTLESFLANKPVFHCENCGFSSRSMHWQCPGCKQWDRIKPIHGIEGD